MRLFFVKILTYFCCSIQVQAQNSKIVSECTYSTRATYFYDLVKQKTEKKRQIVEKAFFTNKVKVLSILYKDEVVEKIVIYTNDTGGACIGYVEYDNTGREINYEPPQLDGKTNTFLQWKFLSDSPCSNLYTKCKKNDCGDIEEVLIYSVEDPDWLIKKYKYEYSNP